MFLRINLWLAVLLAFNSSISYAWGSKGHDVIAKLAAQIFEVKYGEKAPDYSKILSEKAEMLGHLANVPDVYWKSLPKDITRDLNPTHYIDMEYISDSPSFESFPKNVKDFYSVAKDRCKTTDMGNKTNCAKVDVKDVLRITGSVHFRINQLSLMMENQLKLLNKQDGLGETKTSNTKKGMPKEKIEYIDNSLLYAGVLSHFVGDIGQPFHATVDYDGWQANQGGIHAFYEVDLVNVLSNSWEDEVVKYALDFKPVNKFIEQIKKAKKEEADALDLAIALAVDSISQKNRILTLDKVHAIKKASKKTENAKRKADRKSPRDVLPYFRQSLKERVALSADMLAYIWFLSYKNAGFPDVKGYKSYKYPLKPEPILINYY